MVKTIMRKTCKAVVQQTAQQYTYTNSVVLTNEIMRITHYGTPIAVVSMCEALYSSEKTIAACIQ